MAYLATNHYDATAAQTVFVITWEFIEDSHVKLKVAGVSSTDFTLAVDGNSITVGGSHVFTGGERVTVYRDTPIDPNWLSFQSGSPIKASESNLSRRQLAYVIQEALDRTLDNAALDNDFLPSGGATTWDAGERELVGLSAPTSASSAARKVDLDGLADLDTLHQYGATRNAQGDLNQEPVRFMFADAGWKGGALDKGWKAGNKNEEIVLFKEEIPANALIRGASLTFDVIGEYFVRNTTVADNVLKFNALLDGRDFASGNTNLKSLLNVGEVGCGFLGFGVAPGTSPFPASIDNADPGGVDTHTIVNGDDLIFHVHGEVFSLTSEELWIRGWTEIAWIDKSTVPGSGSGDPHPYLLKKPFAFMTRSARGQAGNNDTVNPDRDYLMDQPYDLTVGINAGNDTTTDTTNWESYAQVKHVNFRWLGANR